MIIGAIDIGGTKIALGLVDDTGRLLAKRVMGTSAETGLMNGLSRIEGHLRELSRQCGVDMEGIGIACTGPVDPETGELAPNAFLPGWEGRGLVQGLADCFHLPLAMENDADAAALAEGRWGQGKGHHCFLYLTVSTGIGGGLLIDGRLFRGAGGAHPEIGHHAIDPSGPLCESCGAHGCWEVLCAGPAIARRYQILRGGAMEQAANARQVCDLARQHDPLAVRVVNETARYLGMGIANLITLFTPDYISLGGGVMTSWDLFEPEVRETVRRSCGLVPYQRTLIQPASLGSDTNLLGAAQAWFHRFHI